MENKIEIYKTSRGAEVSVQLEMDTVWLDAHNIAEVFGVNRPAIVKHIGNIYKSEELEMVSTCSILEQVAADGKKRIAAACFLYFLQQNNSLLNSKGETIISNETLATLTLYIANSLPEECEIVKHLIISILNRNK